MLYFHVSFCEIARKTLDAHFYHKISDRDLITYRLSASVSRINKKSLRYDDGKTYENWMAKYVKNAHLFAKVGRWKVHD